ncbi:MAG: hypothetical protein ACFCUI_12410 [Bernardetiaceae bacterium]
MKKESRLFYLLQELLIVTTGVLIAVSINNYKESLDDKQYLQKTLLAIENEIKLTQVELDTVLEKHLKLYQKLEDEWGEREQTIGEFVANSGGFQVAFVQNISLRFFVAHKAELLDFETISGLAEIESRANLLSKKLDRFTDFAYQNISAKNPEAFMEFAYLLSDVIDGEQALLESYADFLKKHEAPARN